MTLGTKAGLNPTAIHVGFVVDKLVPQHLFSCQTSFQQCSTSIHLLFGDGTTYNIEGLSLAPPVERRKKIQNTKHTLHCKEKGNSTTEPQEGLKNNTLDHVLSFNV